MDEHPDALGRERRVMLSVQHFTLAPGLPARTDYVSTLPARFAGRYRKHLDIFDLPFEARGFTLFAAWPSHSQTDPAHMWLRDTLASLAAS
jgi:DNA-binding transcriptional LysR family regulator